MLRAADSESEQNLAMDNPARHIGSLQFSWSFHIVFNCSHPLPSIVLTMMSLKEDSVLPIRVCITALAPPLARVGASITGPPTNSENLSKSMGSGVLAAK